MAKRKKKYEDIAIVLAFPDNWAKGEKLRDRILYSLKITYTQYYKVGHAALLLIERSTGKVEYFDYGRYISPHKRGRVRSRDTDPKLHIPLKAEFDPSGNINNITEIMTYLESIREATHGFGRTFYSERRNVDFKIGRNFINKLIDKGSIHYTALGVVGMNCASFVTKTILMSSKPSLDLLKIMISETIAPTPIGNVVNSARKGIIWKQYMGQVEKLKYNRLKVLFFLYKNILLSRNKKQLLVEKVNEMGIVQNKIPKGLPENSQFVYGLGESAWMHIRKCKSCLLNEYVVESFTKDKMLNYSVIVEDREGCFNINEPFQFTHDCIRLRTTIMQNGKKIIFYLVKENQGLEEENLVKAKTKII